LQPQTRFSNSRLEYFVSITAQVSKQLMGKNGEVRGNRVPLRAVVCSRMTQYANMPAHVECAGILA